MSQRLCTRLGAELRGSFASFSRAAKRSSGATDMSSALDFRAARLAAYCATIFSRFLFRFIWLSLAMFFFSAPFGSIDERHLKTGEQGFCLFVGLGGRLNDDVHAPDGFGLVVVDLYKDDVLFETHRPVAAP